MICNEITPCENGGWRSVQCNRSFLTYHSSEIVFLGVVHGLEVSVLSITISSRSSSPPRGGGYSQNNWEVVGGPLPKTLTLFMTKVCDFPYPIYDLTKNLKPYL